MMLFEGGGGVWGDFPVTDVSSGGQQLVQELFLRQTTTIHQLWKESDL